MAAHRYWRARYVAPKAGKAVALSALHLYFVGARVDAAATLTAAVPPTSGTLSNLSDTDLTTGAGWLRAVDIDLTWDFGSGGGTDVDGVRVGSTAAINSMFAGSFSLWYSDDGVAWTRLADWVGDYPGPEALTAGFFGWTPTDYLSRMQLEFIGADGSTSIVDDGNPAITWTANGAAQLKTNNFKWAPSALYLNGVNSYIATTGPNTLLFTESDFCLEMWFLIEDRTNNWSTLIADASTSTFSSQALMVYGDSNTAVPASARGCLGWSDSTSFTRLVSLAPVTTGVWHNVKLMRVMSSTTNGTFSLWLDGVQQGTYGLNGGNVQLGNNGTIIGRTNYTTGIPSAQSYFKGYIGEVRFLRGASDVGAYLHPVRHPVPRRALGLATREKHLGYVQSLQVPVAFSGATRVRSPARTKDLTSGFLGKGIGRVRGTTKDKGTPNVPVSEKVRLYREQDGLLVGETWSTPGTGAYLFDQLDEYQTYTVISYDHDKAFRGVVADGLNLLNGGVELMQ